MNPQILSTNLQPLDKSLRKKLESSVKDARDVVEEAARAACMQLGVGRAEPDSHLNEEERDLRRRLRIHGRQLGDDRDKSKKTQELDRLIEEIGYQHWHRMLFARFLAENNLLMYPDPDQPVAISLDECEDLAADEGAKNGWELAARYAAKMLPQIFRVDSPVFSLTLPTESQQELEKILSDLPTEVFTASDSLGWVYQFWQSKRKDEVNASEVKIGARELPAVTQLFTEPYMVSFLLDNSLGAWWAGKRLTEEDLRTAETEQELREKAALPGVPLEYLRFVRTPSADVSGTALAAGSSESASTGDSPAASAVGSQEENTGPWTPAAGTFDAWPEAMSELKTLDPCCGSGHFLVAALLMLTPMRMELEGLSAKEAVDRVLSENLHGLEIDQRCVELAAFALALAAWRFPDAGGYRVLPDLNVACCGLSVSVAKEEWKELARGNKQLKIALDWMYDEFKDAPVLGSLLNPAKSMAARVVKWDELSPLIDDALTREGSAEDQETAVVAHGLARAALLLGARYEWIVTNVPYKKINEMVETMEEFAASYSKDASAALEAVFIDRCIGFQSDTGVCSLVLPQNWLFLRTYKKFRKRHLEHDAWRFLARLGPGAFETISGEVVKAILLIVSGNQIAGSDAEFFGLDVALVNGAREKSRALTESAPVSLHQKTQLANPDHRITLVEIGDDPKLDEHAECFAGILNGDSPRFLAQFWEVQDHSDLWALQQTTVNNHQPFGGLEQMIFFDSENGHLREERWIRQEKLHDSDQRGNRAWGKWGIGISQMNMLPVSLYTGAKFDSNIAVIYPKDPSIVLPIWAYCQDDDYRTEVRKIDQKMNVTNATLVKVPFDLAHWQQVASEKYPHGLPEPYSDDPTQWIFHGHPASSTDALQVAVARLLGYRWPAELDAEMELATDARAWVERSSQLTGLADNDGIVCIPAVGTEQPAEDRLLNLLHRAYEEGQAQEQVFRGKLDAADSNDGVTVDLWRRGWQPSLPDSFNQWRDSLLEDVGHQGKTLESWLRDKFFIQHCKLFQHRPFTWHIWDGLRDGFSALVNYHKLDNKLLKTLIYTYLNDWINRQSNSNEDGSEERLAAAESLKQKLEKILAGESPNDIFVRWKPLEGQPIGWNPDLNDGVRLNIRPWMTVGDVGKRGAGVLRDKPNCKWKKDRGKDVESAPWYHLGPEYGEKEGSRINDHHLTLAEKKNARER